MQRKVIETNRGVAYAGDSLKIIQSKRFLDKYQGKIDLIFTSPPFNLTKKKSYGNKIGNEYVDWLESFALPLTNLLSEKGSIVIELGNAFEKGVPVFSTTPIEALLAFKKKAELFLCQEFICNNPSRIPSPAEWVTVRRIRVKDSYTRLWWMSKSEYPKANNKKILREYSEGMKNILKNSKKANYGKRPSGHTVTKNFLKDNGGSISPNFLDFESSDYLFKNSALSIANTNNESDYVSFCRENNLEVHPARIQHDLIQYFIEFLTDADDTVFDPFGGSGSTGMIAQNLNRNWVSSELNIDYIKGSHIRFYDAGKSKSKIEKLAREGV